VILDNLAAHKVEGVRPLIENRAYNCFIFRLIHPTSIPSSLLGRSWNSCSAELRRDRLDQLEPAVARAIAAITPENALVYFRLAERSMVPTA